MYWRRIPTKWNTLSLTADVGWDFIIARELKFRPVANFSYGRVASDGAVAGSFLENQTGEEFEFLKNGNLDVIGLGGTLMLDYERYRLKNEIDVELRLTDMQLKSVDDAPAFLSEGDQQQRI